MQEKLENAICCKGNIPKETEKKIFTAFLGSLVIPLKILTVNIIH